MLNIFRFIWRNNVLFLFLLLEVISFILIIQANNFHRSKFISSANVASGSMMLALSEIKEYVHLKEINDSLAKENAMLRSLSKDSYFIYDDSTYQVTDSIYQQQYIYTPAKVINNSIYKRNNYITLNKGGRDGIDADMGVICGNGIVGVVVDVSEYFSVVKSLLHKKTEFSVAFKKNNEMGSLQWDGFNPQIATVIDIPNYVIVNVGDTILTSSSSFFPTGIMVGTVSEFIAKSGNELSIAKVKLSVNFNSLSYVYIINNLKKGEQLQLEQKNKEHDKE